MRYRQWGAVGVGASLHKPYANPPHQKFSWKCRVFVFNYCFLYHAGCRANQCCFKVGMGGEAS